MHVHSATAEATAPGISLPYLPLSLAARSANTRFRFRKDIASGPSFFVGSAAESSLPPGAGESPALGTSRVAKRSPMTRRSADDAICATYTMRLLDESMEPSSSCTGSMMKPDESISARVYLLSADVSGGTSGCRTECDAASGRTAQRASGE